MQERKAEKPELVSVKEIIFRGLFGGSVVAAIVILGDSAGYIWGGLFSSFPGTITPVLILLHLKNGKDMSYGVIKSAPIGLSGTGLIPVWLAIISGIRRNCRNTCVIPRSCWVPICSIFGKRVR